MYKTCPDCGSNLDYGEVCDCCKAVNTDTNISENAKEIKGNQIEHIQKKRGKTMNAQIETIIKTGAVQTASNFLLDATIMKNLVATATYLSQSTMIPKEYQGNSGSCLIACEMAARVNLSPLMVMQQLSVVNGRPSWSGQACTALVNQSRRYDKPLKIVFVGERGTDSWGAYAVAYQGDEEFRGTTVDWKLVKGEGWDKRTGSKWQTMPEQMFKYRAASFFAREHCPDILMGCMVEGEAEDIHQREDYITLPDMEQQAETDKLNMMLGDEENEA